MESFSQRQGIKLMKSIVQIDSMDDDLRNSLWNALTLCYWDSAIVNFVFNGFNFDGVNSNNTINDLKSLIIDLWSIF